ncbi:MAG: hypothetical protein JO091_10905 [Acidobacteriaceae bacterium]|nr:hypothetical protein [Acidobacteriaceae bacterium]
MLERLDAPGFLSRDLVATHPNFAYTIYDEVTLSLHEAAHLPFRTALAGQQLVSRGAAIIGVFLLAVAAGLDDVLALLVAALINLGATLNAPAVVFADREPVPSAFAFGLMLLAAGLLAREKPLLAGLAGGLALVYEASIVAPFWIVVLIAFLVDGRLRRLLRPALTILIVFALLLANLAQLQPGVVENRELLSKLSEPFAALQQYRTPFVWISLWPAGELWHYAAILVCGFWATIRIWPALPRTIRWLLVALPICGLLSVPLSDLLLDHLKWSLISVIQPARSLLYSVMFASIACAIAGAKAANSRNYMEAGLWFIPVAAIPMKVRMLDLLRITGHDNRLQLALAAIIAIVLVAFLRQLGHSRWKALVLLVPAGAAFAIPAASDFGTVHETDRRSITAVADWASANTWGSSMFLFPDAGREPYPGIFRGESLRALWVDWESGMLVPYFESFAAQWWPRWEETMRDGFSPQQLDHTLSLPIDYYVLKGTHELPDVRAVFRNADFVVYDAADLRNARARSRPASASR